MSVVRFIAARYVWPRQFSVISIIGGISVLGMVIGTAALIVVMSLFNGFRDVAYNLMIGFGPHVQVVAAQGRTLPNPERAIGALHEVGFTQARLSSESRLVLTAGGRTSVVEAVGVESDTVSVLRGPREATFVGGFMTQVKQDVASLVVASGVAERMGVYVGDTVELLSPQAIERAVNTMTLPRGVRAVVRGIFQSNAAREIDHSRVYVSQSALGRAIGTVAATSADAVYVSAAQAVEQAESSAERLRTMLGPGYTVRTWADVNRGLVETMKLERVGSFIVLALIIVVAAFNVLVALSLGVVEKRRDIAVLLTLGLRPRDIRMMYIRQGLALGIVAVGIGLLLGVGLTWGQITYSWISFDVSQGYLVPALPMKIEVLDVLLTAAVGLVLAATAAAYPAGRAARTQIADALRSE